MENVPAVTVDEIGDGSDFAFAVGAGDEKDSGILHGRAAVPAAVAAAVLPPQRERDAPTTAGKDAGATSLGPSRFLSRHLHRILPSIPRRDACRCRTSIDSESAC